MSDDPAMRQAYLEGKDLYCVIAAKIYNNNYEDKEVEDEDIVKRYNEQYNNKL